MSMVCVLEYLREGSYADNDCLKVEFRLVVFRPFKDEVLLGRISSAKEDGIRSKFMLSSPIVSSNGRSSHSIL